MQKTRTVKEILKKNVTGLKISDFKTYYKGTIIKTL